MDVENVIVKLFNVKGLKFGRFEMRNGEITPVYIDMRVIWSYPDIMKSVCDLIWKKLQCLGLEYQHLCGLPYQGIPIASYLAIEHQVPMLLKRQCPKSYGTKQLFEGHFMEGDKVVMIDDVIMTGGTIVDDIKTFNDHGLEAVCCAAFIDRNQGGIDRVAKHYPTKVVSVCSLHDAFQILLKHQLVDQETVDATKEYLKQNQFSEMGPCSKMNGH